MPDRDALVPIGELARRTGTTSSALRYYERLGLLTADQRAGGRRHYIPSSAERVALIRLCQDAGFTLAETSQLLAEGSDRRQSWLGLAESKIEELDVRIAEAQHARELLVHALNCPHGELVSCPNFRAALQARLTRDASSGRKSEPPTASAADPGSLRD